MADTYHGDGSKLFSPIVTIDGMPATGKTEIIKALVENSSKRGDDFKVKVVSNDDDDVLLGRYHTNPGKYAKLLHFSRLSKCLLAMQKAKLASTANECDLIVLERSLYGNRVAFEVDLHRKLVSEETAAHYQEKFAEALVASGHPHYYFLLSDYNMTQAVERAQATANVFDAAYFTQCILTQTRLFETIDPAFPVIHHFVLNVATNMYYLNETIKKIESLAKYHHTADV